MLAITGRDGVALHYVLYIQMDMQAYTHAHLSSQDTIVLAILHLSQDKQWSWLATRSLTDSDGCRPSRDAISHCPDVPLLSLWR